MNSHFLLLKYQTPFWMKRISHLILTLPFSAPHFPIQSLGNIQLSNTEIDTKIRDALAALAEVPLQSISKFAIWSQQFMNAYSRGLNGRQAAWATHKYCSHHVLQASHVNSQGA